MARLGGSIRLDWKPDGNMEHLEVWTETLSDAPAAVEFRSEKFRHRCGSSGWERDGAIRQELQTPDKAAVSRACERAEGLIAEAQGIDSRLVKRSRWVRSTEGETACPSLLLAGEENPFFARKRELLGEATAGEPVIITVSTDASEVSADSLAAFVATVKLVQQFRPVHVVWQGAWLNASRNAGYVFHCPVITGDMDFERLAFVINSPLRDSLSFAVMVRRAMTTTNRRWNGCEFRAEMSYLPGSVDFISHEGILPSAESIAERACRWLGWESPWLTRYKEQNAGVSALCRWTEGEESMREPVKSAASGGDSDSWEAMQKRWAREDVARAKAQAAEARNRARAAAGK